MFNKQAKTEDLIKAFELIGKTNELIERLANVVLQQNDLIDELQKDIKSLNKKIECIVKRKK